MFKSFWFACCAGTLLASGIVAAAPRTLRAVEQAAESPSLDLDLSSSTSGQVIARLCDGCELLTLQVNAATAVFLHGARATLQLAAERKDQGATVFFDPATLIVNRIVLWD